MKVPFVDLHAQYLSIQEEIDKAIATVISESAYIGGNYVSAFESEFQKFLAVKHVVSCANGTDSIEIILKVAGVGPGDEVIVPAVSWISTSEAVSAVGATPIFVDIDESFYTIDTKLIEQKISSRTKAIIPVHLYGQPADMPAIMDIARKHKLFVLEDCAQAHGSDVNGRITGTIGDAASFSFYPGKNLGAYGDAGAIATNSDEIAHTCRLIANHGQKTKHQHSIEGRNSRMDGLHAAVLSVKLKYLDSWNSKRIGAAAHYDQLLAGRANIIVPKIQPGNKHVYHLYVIRVGDRNNIQQKLKSAGVETALHYPTALPFLDCYKHKNFKPADFPVAYKFTSQLLSLPVYPEISKEQIKYVCDNL